MGTTPNTAAIYVRRSAVDSANTEADALSRILAAQECECLAWAEHQGVCELGYYSAMKVIDYYLESWRRFRDLQGRTTRPAFWWPFLIHPIVFLVLGGIFAAILGLSTDQTGPEVVYAIAYVWVLITLGVRRLHDMGRKGTWLLLGLVPLGNLVLLYWLVQPSTSEASE